MKKAGWVIRSEEGYLTRKPNNGFGSLFEAYVFPFEIDAKSHAAILNENKIDTDIQQIKDIPIRIEKIIKFL